MRTTDASEMGRWPGRRAGLSLKLPDLDPTDGRLVGARLSSLADGPAAYPLYEWGGRHLSLFIARPVLGADRGGAEEVVDDVALGPATLRGVVLA